MPTVATRTTQMMIQGRMLVPEEKIVGLAPEGTIGVSEDDVVGML